MKKIGIVGGIAWPSTVLYYSELCRRGEQRHLAHNLPGTPATPEFSIESLDLAKVVSYFGADGNEESWANFDAYHRDALKRLEANGADFALMASNTPHHRFESIVRGIGIPVLNLLDVVAKECVRIGVRQILLLGTAVTMKSPRFREEFAKYGIEAAGPHDEAAGTMTVDLIADLQLGKLAGAPERIMNIVKLSWSPQHTARPAVCLACTELPLAFETMKTLATFEHGGVLFINTPVIHINAAFDLAIEQ